MAKKRQSEPTVAPVEQPSEQEDQDVGFVRANVDRSIIVSPHFVSIYANDVQVQTSPWDIRLILGEIHSIAEGSPASVTVRHLGEVRLSPQLAKRLTIIMIQQLQGYEKRFGAIPVPPD